MWLLQALQLVVAAGPRQLMLQGFPIQLGTGTGIGGGSHLGGAGAGAGGGERANAGSGGGGGSGGGSPQATVTETFPWARVYSPTRLVLRGGGGGGGGIVGGRTGGVYPMVFAAKGRGEVSIATTMAFTPRYILVAAPVYYR